MAEVEKTALAGDSEAHLDVISKYDPEFRFRTLTGIMVKIAVIMTQILSIFHIYTAGFGVLQEWRHRAFHLAFVLPLSYFYYSIRKTDTEGRKFFIYDIIYGIIGSAVTTAIFREILELSATRSAILAVISFCLVIYFKRREYWQGKLIGYSDFAIFTGMLAGFFLGVYKAYYSINFHQVFNQPNMTLLFWSVLLFATLLVLVLIFLLRWIQALVPIFTTGKFNYQRDNIPYFDVFMALFAAAFSVFIFLEYNSLVFRAGVPLKLDLFIGGMAIILILEGARRSIGPPLPIISIFVLINCYLGPYFLNIPGLSFFAHRGYSIDRIIEHMFLGTEGIYGIPLGVVATFVFHFVLFGIFIAKTGLGQLFMDLAMALAGWSAGGPAKVAVISSGFMGS
ncbi:MAG: TRAP transporter large permease subunit, partial [Deltaproteobacteria bacterium]|nr:TRAP transporter large permease subunit [Deltaproteobacteria bacterium]